MSKYLLLAGLLITPALVGCGGGGVKEKEVEIKIAVKPMDQVKATLDNYIKGQPMSSESMQFQELVGRVREEDPAKADILSEGLEELKTTPKAQLPGKAKALKSKLGLK